MLLDWPEQCRCVRLCELDACGRKTVDAAPLFFSLPPLSLSLLRLSLSHSHKCNENHREQIWARFHDGSGVFLFAAPRFDGKLIWIHRIPFPTAEVLKMFVFYSYVKKLTTWMSRNYIEWLANVSFRWTFFLPEWIIHIAAWFILFRIDFADK